MLRTWKYTANIVYCVIQDFIEAPLGPKALQLNCRYKFFFVIFKTFPVGCFALRTFLQGCIIWRTTGPLKILVLRKFLRLTEKMVGLTEKFRRGEIIQEET